MEVINCLENVRRLVCMNAF